MDEPRAPRVLLADDDPLFRDSAAMTMKDAGYEVSLALNARAGAAMLLERAFDVIVADIHMAGNERLQWLQELALRAPGVPVVVVTGHPSLTTAVAAVGLPAIAYLLKPVSSRTLLHALARAIERGVPVEGRDRTRARFEASLERHRESWGLSPRQVEALERLVQGASNKEIATELGCALRTAELHVSAILERSGSTSRSTLIARFWADP